MNIVAQVNFITWILQTERQQLAINKCILLHFPINLFCISLLHSCMQHQIQQGIIGVQIQCSIEIHYFSKCNFHVHSIKSKNVAARCCSDRVDLVWTKFCSSTWWCWPFLHRNPAWYWSEHLGLCSQCQTSDGLTPLPELATSTCRCSLAAVVVLQVTNTGQECLGTRLLTSALL